MIKLVINTPKGGVGKTTTASNIALLLALKGYRVWAVDLAGGLLMSQALMTRPEFADKTANKIDQREAESIPEDFPGASNFDFAVLDTDDSFTVGEDLLLGTRPSWRVISPVNPHDPVGLSRIPRELRAVTATTLMSPSKLQISVVTNMAFGGDTEQGFNQLKAALEECGIRSLLVKTILPHGHSQSIPFLLDDVDYNNALTAFLEGLNL
ncbi:MAG: chromosome partitioning protein [Phenylobacterium sp.]|jgi:chromosome partitioning protein